MSTEAWLSERPTHTYIRRFRFKRLVTGSLPGGSDPYIIYNIVSARVRSDILYFSNTLYCVIGMCACTRRTSGEAKYNIYYSHCINKKWLFEFVEIRKNKEKKILFQNCQIEKKSNEYLLLFAMINVVIFASSILYSYYVWQAEFMCFFFGEI